MKRFLVFAGEYCYPEGGWADLRGSYDSIEAALGDNPPQKRYVVDGTIVMRQWLQIVDTETNMVHSEGC